MELDYLYIPMNHELESLESGVLDFGYRQDQGAHHADTDDNAKAPQGLAASSTHQEDAAKDAEAARPRNNGRAEAIRHKDLQVHACVRD